MYWDVNLVGEASFTDSGVLLSILEILRDDFERRRDLDLVSSLTGLTGLETCLSSYYNRYSSDSIISTSGYLKTWSSTVSFYVWS